MKIEIGEDGNRIRVEWDTGDAREVSYDRVELAEALFGPSASGRDW